jgi:LysM repeat protein/lysophospholipase L1-like esterase
MTVQTTGQQVWLDLQIRHDTLINYAFDQVKLFSVAGDDKLNWSFGQFKDTEKVAVAAPPKVYHTVRSGDTLYGLALRHRTSVKRLQQWNNLRGTMIKPGQKLVVGNGHSTSSNYDRQLFEVQQMLKWETGPSQSQCATVQLDSLSRRLLLRGRRTDGKSGQTRIYGISLENRAQSGLLYHAIGVNGVTYYHYNEAPEFWEQLPFLEPDLIIVSLGTNETAISSFKPTSFSEQVRAFAEKLKALPGNIPVLLTTPADALRSRRYDNPAIKVAGEIISETAASNGFTVWDLYDVMGGAGSIKQWRSAQLTARDYLHFTKMGYELQGELLFKALMQAYGEH